MTVWLPNVDSLERSAVRPHFRAAVLIWCSLLASAATFVGGALPILSVELGIKVVPALRATAAFLAAVEGGNGIFGLSGLLLSLAALAVWSAGCPQTLDSEIVRHCDRIRHWNRWVLRTSAGLWLAAVIAACIAPAVRHAFGW
jgi:hypothetical protein